MSFRIPLVKAPAGWGAFHAESLMTAFAIEMGVRIIIVVCVMTGAEFVSHAVATVFDDMHQMVFLEDAKRTEYIRFVNGQMMSSSSDSDIGRSMSDKAFTNTMRLAVGLMACFVAVAYICFSSISSKCFICYRHRHGSCPDVGATESSRYSFAISSSVYPKSFANEARYTSRHLSPWRFPTAVGTELAVAVADFFSWFCRPLHLSHQPVRWVDRWFSFPVDRWRWRVLPSDNRWVPCL